jgi:CarD family transcriptional regulator
MPSIRKTAKGPKTSTERRTKSAKTARKPANSSKEGRGKTARGKAETAPSSRKISSRSASSPAKEATKAVARTASKRTAKSAAKSASKTGAKKTETKKTSAVQKTTSRKGVPTKIAAKPATTRNSARGGKIAANKRAAPASKNSAKKGVILAQQSKATAAATNSAATKKQEKSTQIPRPRETPAPNPVANPLPAVNAGARTSAAESTTPVASEAIQVAKIITETAAKPVARKPAPLVIDGAQNDERISLAKSAAPPARPAAVGAKPRAASTKLGFKLSEFIVYPAHGVGQIIGIEVQEVAGFSLELFVVSFIKDKMILKVPTAKVTAVGMRKLAEVEIVDKALATLSGRARVKRTMWSRRAQEYEAKINSGDLVTIAEVVRDLYRSDTQPEQSYSERQLYEAALDRMAREVAAVRKLIDSEALKVIESFLLKGPRRGAKTEADIADDGPDDADVDRAA